MTISRPSGRHLSITDMLSSDSDPRISERVSKAVTKWSVGYVDAQKQHDDFEEYRKYTARKWIFMIVCIVIVIVVMGVAITIGSYDIGFFESYEIIWNHLVGNIQNTTTDYIVVQLRLPRIIVGIIAGAGLAVTGAVMQSTLMNPLADAYTTGVSSGASFGATLAMTVGITVASGSYAIVLNAFIFALIPTAMIIGIARMRHTSPTTMIMAGIAIMYVFNAMTTVLMLWADANDKEAVYEWQVGSLSSASWSEIPIMLIVTLVGIVAVQLLSRQLNVLATGDDSANALGIDANKMRALLLAIVSLIAAAIVSFTGLIGFVGLVVPHIVRIFVGADNRYLIPASAVCGAALLVVADLIGRTVLSPIVLQVGVIMAFLGGPAFLWLMLRRNSRVWG